MQAIEGKRKHIILDKDLLELEKKYQKLKGARPRSELIRELYYFFLNEELEKEEND